VRFALILVLLSCGQPSRTPPSQIARPSAPEATTFPRWHLACSGEPSAMVKRTIYEFSPLPLLPVRRGPRVEQHSRAGHARTDAQVQELIRRENASIIGCWKWASARGAPATSLDLAVTIGPDGASHGIELSGAGAGTRELERCLRDNLDGTALIDRSSRTTKFRATLAFVRVDQPPWPQPPERPMPARRAARARSCGPVLDGVLPDIVAEPRPFLVEDRDPSREPHKPEVMLGCVSVRPTPNKHRVRAAFASNRGAFQTCYAAARERAGLTPEAPGGKVTVQLRFGSGGVPETVVVRGDGDSLFHTCVRAAARDVWLTPALEHLVDVTFPFELRPVPAPATTPEEMFAADDIDGALAAWTLEARTTTGAAACRARANIARAHIARAPWLEDARVSAAFAELGRAATALLPTDGVACVAPVAGSARELAFSEINRGHRWDIVARTSAVLPLARVMPWGDEIRMLHAEALLHSSRRSDGIAALEAMRDDRALSTRAQTALDELRARTILLTPGCF
jgi:hypothetical protein